MTLEDLQAKLVELEERKERKENQIKKLQSKLDDTRERPNRDENGNLIEENLEHNFKLSQYKEQLNKLEEIQEEIDDINVKLWRESLKENKRYYIVAYKLVNGFIRDFRLLEYGDKERLEYLYESNRWITLKNANYKFEILKQEEVFANDN